MVVEVPVLRVEVVAEVAVQAVAEVEVGVGVVVEVVVLEVGVGVEVEVGAGVEASPDGFCGRESWKRQRRIVPRMDSSPSKLVTTRGFT